jgi:hypothetical protein
MDVSVSNQGSLKLISTLGEPIPDVQAHEGVFIISGFYPYALFDTSGTSGVSSFIPIEGLKAWPNPAYVSVVLSLEDVSHPEYQIRLYSATGQHLKSEKWPSGTSTLDLSLHSFTSGCYYVQVSDFPAGKITYLEILKQ